MRIRRGIQDMSLCYLMTVGSCLHCVGASVHDRCPMLDRNHAAVGLSAAGSSGVDPRLPWSSSRCWWRSASPTSRRARSGTRSRTAFCGARVPKASRPSRSRRIGRRAAGHPARRRAARRQRLADRRRLPTSSNSSTAAHDGTRLRLHVAAVSAAQQALDVALAPTPRGSLDVFRARRRSACSRCSSARRSGCAVPATRRRCISSGCASRSSACSRFSFNGPFDRLDWIVLLGRRDRDARCCRRCCLHFTMVFPERPTRGRRDRIRAPLARAADVRAGAGARRGARDRRRARRAGQLAGRLFSRVTRRPRSCRAASTCSSRARRRRWSCWCARSGRSRR